MYVLCPNQQDKLYCTHSVKPKGQGLDGQHGPVSPLSPMLIDSFYEYKFQMFNFHIFTDFLYAHQGCINLIKNTVNAVIIVKYYVKCESVKVIVFYLYIFSSVMYSHDGKDTFILISNVENSCAA